MVRAACLACLISTVRGHSNKKVKMPLEEGNKITSGDATPFQYVPSTLCANTHTHTHRG
jgi:hypothetical protein